MDQKALAAAACLFLAPVSLAGQAVLTGIVREDSTNSAVPGVEVVIEAVNKKATTDTDGRFALGGLDHGAHIVLVRAIGYRPILLRAYLVTNDTLVIDLRIRKAPVELAPLEVTVSAIPPGLDAFEERRLLGFGKFIDWTMLRKAEHRRVSDLFREIPGVRIHYNKYGQPYLESAREHCPMQIYFNGIEIYRRGGNGEPPVVDMWSVTDFDAIEIYRGPSEAPIAYGGTGGNCGTVMLWTRRH